MRKMPHKDRIAENAWRREWQRKRMLDPALRERKLLLKRKHPGTCAKCGKQFLGRSPTGKFCSRSCAILSMWENGLENRFEPHGTGRYKHIRRNDKTTTQHRMIMEAHLGRKLLTTEHVHHLNGDRGDNRIENLVVMSQTEHAKLHTKRRPDTD